MQNHLLELIYLICGFNLLYIAIKTVSEKEHLKRISTGLFWGAFGTVMGFGTWLPSNISGFLVVFMCFLVFFKQVGIGNIKSNSLKHAENMADKLGFKILLPVFLIGVITLFIAIFTKLGALVGLGLAAIISGIITLVLTYERPSVFLIEGRKLLETIGPLLMFPMLLSALGAVFAAAGVGDVIASAAGKVIPKGNIFLGTTAYALGMVMFTILMGNAFAAFSVITIGIGIPFVLEYGLDPDVIGMLGLACGCCGTLLTPMAANYNMIPVKILDMKDKYGVIKNQLAIGVIMLVFQILLMNIMG